jgi:hypothetical protein
VFVEPAARKLVRNWKDRARRLLAEFRADYSRGLDDPRLREMVDGLRRGSAFFDGEWNSQSVLGREGGCAASRIPGRGRSPTGNTATALPTAPTPSSSCWFLRHSARGETLLIDTALVSSTPRDTVH